MRFQDLTAARACSISTCKQVHGNNAEERCIHVHTRIDDTAICEGLGNGKQTTQTEFGPRILTSNALTGQQPKQLLNLGKAGLAFGLLLAYSQ